MCMCVYTCTLVEGFWYIYIYIYIYREIEREIFVYKLAIVVVSNLKAPFSITTTPRYSEGRYSFLWIAPLILDPFLIILSVKQGGYKFFESLVPFDLWLNPGLLEQWRTSFFVFVILYVILLDMVNFWPCQKQ